MADTCICPYDNNHVVKHTRFVNHLLKCGKHNPDVHLFKCAFNHAHLVPEELMQAHFQNCPDALSSRLKYKVSRNYLTTVIAEASEALESGIAVKETPELPRTKVKNWLEQTDGVLHGSDWDDDVNVAHKVSREIFCQINGHHSERHSDLLKKDTDELYPSNEGSVTPNKGEMYLEVGEEIMASLYNPKSDSREAKQLKDSELSSVVSFSTFADEQNYASEVCSAVSEVDDSSEDAIPSMEIFCGNHTTGKKDSRKGGGMYLDELAKRKARLCDALKKIELKTTLQANIPVLRNHLQSTSQAEPGSCLWNKDGIKLQEDSESSLDSFIGTKIMINQGKIDKTQLMPPVGISRRHVSIGTQKNDSFTVNTSQSFIDDEHEVVSSDDDSGNEWKNRRSLVQQQNAPETFEGASSFADGESTFSYCSREELIRDAVVDTASTASDVFSVDGRKISFSSEVSGTKARTRPSLLEMIRLLKKSPKSCERESCEVSGTETRPELSLIKTVASLKENESLFEDAESTVSSSSTAGQLPQSARKKWSNEAMDNDINRNMDNDEGAKFNIAPSTSQVVINGSHNGSSSCEDSRPKARTGCSLLGMLASRKKASEACDNESVFEDAMSSASYSYFAGEPSQTKKNCLNRGAIDGEATKFSLVSASQVKEDNRLQVGSSCEESGTKAKARLSLLKIIASKRKALENGDEFVFEAAKSTASSSCAVGQLPQTENLYITSSPSRIDESYNVASSHDDSGTEDNFDGESTFEDAKSTFSYRSLAEQQSEIIKNNLREKAVSNGEATKLTMAYNEFNSAMGSAGKLSGIMRNELCQKVMHNGEVIKFNTAFTASQVSSINGHNTDPACKVSETKTRTRRSLLETVKSLKKAAEHSDNETVFEDAKSTVSLSSAGQLGPSQTNGSNIEGDCLRHNSLKVSCAQRRLELHELPVSCDAESTYKDTKSAVGCKSFQDVQVTCSTSSEFSESTSNEGSGKKSWISLELLKTTKNTEDMSVAPYQSVCSWQKGVRAEPAETSNSVPSGKSRTSLLEKIKLRKSQYNCGAESTFESAKSAHSCSSGDEVARSIPPEVTSSVSSRSSRSSLLEKFALCKASKNNSAEITSEIAKSDHSSAADEVTCSTPHEVTKSEPLRSSLLEKIALRKASKKSSTEMTSEIAKSDHSSAADEVNCSTPHEVTNSEASRSSRTSLLEKLALRKASKKSSTELATEIAKSDHSSAADEVNCSTPHEVTNSEASRSSRTSLLEKVELCKASKKSSTELTSEIAKSDRSSAADEVNCSTPHEVTNSEASRNSRTSLLDKLALRKASKKSSTELTSEIAKSDHSSAADVVNSSTPHEVTNSEASRSSRTSLLEKVELCKASKKSSTELTSEAAKSDRSSAADEVNCSTPCEVTNSDASRSSRTSLLKKLALRKASKKSSAEATSEIAKSDHSSAADKVTCSTPEITNTVASRRAETSLLENAALYKASKSTIGAETTSENVRPAHSSTAGRLACSSLELKSSTGSVAKSRTSLFKELTHKQWKNNSEVESELKANEVDLLPNFSNNEAAVNEINGASLTTVNPSEDLLHGCDNESAMDDAMSSVSCSRVAGGRMNHITPESNSFGQHSLTKDRLKKFEDMQGNCKSTLSPSSKFLDANCAPEVLEAKPLLSKFLRELRPSEDDFNAASVASGASSVCSLTKLVPNHSTANSNFSISGSASKKTQSSAKYDKIVPRKWHALYRNSFDNEIDYETCLCPKCT